MRTVETIKQPEIDLIRTIISDMEGMLDLSKKFNQQLSEKYRELSIRKRLLQEILKECESRSESELQLCDIWSRNENY